MHNHKIKKNGCEFTMDGDELYLETLRLLVEQTKNEVKYEEEGLTNGILTKQLEINKKRNELDLPDREEFIYEDENGKEWVQ